MDREKAICRLEIQANLHQRFLQRTREKRNRFLQAEGDGPHPLLVYIHGGGWSRGDKQRREADVKPYMEFTTLFMA